MGKAQFISNFHQQNRQMFYKDLVRNTVHKVENGERKEIKVNECTAKPNR